MKRILTLCALLSCAAPLAAQDSAAAQSASDPSPDLSLEQRMLLRCSATFAMVAFRQQHELDEAGQYPPMREAGMEFFVAAGARVMSDAGLSAEQLDAAMLSEAQDIADKGTMHAMMRVCLPLLPG